MKHIIAIAALLALTACAPKPADAADLTVYKAATIDSYTQCIYISDNYVGNVGELNLLCPGPPATIRAANMIASLGKQTPANSIRWTYTISYGLGYADQGFNCVTFVSFRDPQTETKDLDCR